MKKFFFIALLLAGSLVSSSQKIMYLYFESENQAPFYLKIDDKVYTSVAPGYFVLPGLNSGKLKLSVGIPSEIRAENRFEIDINERDRGFSIKKQSEGLVLQDLNDGSTVRFLRDPSQPEITYEPRNDAFTQLLAKASGDPGLLMSPVFAKKEEKPEPAIVKNEIKTEPVNNTSPPETAVVRTEESKPKTEAALPIEKKDTSAVAINTKAEEKPREKPAEPEVLVKQVAEDSLVRVNTDKKVEEPPIEKKMDEAPEAVEYKKTIVTKFAESSTSEGFNLVFIDDPAGESDTIRIQIPNPKYNLTATEAAPANPEKKFLEFGNDDKKSLDQDSLTRSEASPSGKKGKKKEAEPEVKGEANPGIKDTVQQIRKEPVTPDTITKQEVVQVQTPSIPKNDCKSNASDNDFFKLRKNMAAQITDEGMVAEAKKVFRNKCFHTEQIRYLGSLFLTSAGKYLFYDAAFLHVSDQENFQTLETEIKDDYYRKRFKALIGQ